MSLSTKIAPRPDYPTTLVDSPISKILEILFASHFLGYYFADFRHHTNKRQRHHLLVMQQRQQQRDDGAVEEERFIDDDYAQIITNNFEHEREEEEALLLRRRRRRTHQSLPVIHELAETLSQCSPILDYSNNNVLNINWPPDDGTWPPRSDVDDDDDEDNIETPQQKIPTPLFTNYGSIVDELPITLCNHYNLEEEEEMFSNISPATSSSDSDEEDSIRRVSSIFRSTSFGYGGGAGRKRRMITLVLSTMFAVSLLAIAYTPLLQTMKQNIPMTKKKTKKKKGNMKQINYNTDDDDDVSRWHAPWLAPQRMKYNSDDNSTTTSSTWEEGDGGGGGSNDNMLDYDNDDDENIGDAIHVLLKEENVTFSELAAALVPVYFQRTIKLCEVTILPMTINSTTNNTTNNTTTYDQPMMMTNRTTGVMPNEVHTLRKLMLYTKDLLDIFAPVYPQHSSLYDESNDDDWMPTGTTNIITLGGGEVSIIRDSKHHHEHSHHHDHHHDQTKKRNHEKREKGVMGRHKTKTKKTTGKEDEISPTSTPASLRKDSDDDSYDLWEQLRKYLDTGYVLIGNFQDLHNANIKYTHKRLVKYQFKIWQWHTDFMSFVKTNEQIINFYLSFPCKSSGHHRQAMMMMTNNHNSNSNNKRCSDIHDHSSHLFWGGTSKNDLPDGNTELAVHVLGRLGYSQLGRAETYLQDALVYEYVLNSTSVLPNEDANNNTTDDAVNVQEIYHNFRKELRSFLDELDLFGESFIPGSSALPEIVRWHRHTPSSVNITIKKGKNENIDQIINLLMTTRLKLGDVNDNYVKYTRYNKWDIHHVLHNRQPRYTRDMSKVKTTLETQWKEFRQWAVDVELIAKIEFLRYSLYPDESLRTYKEEIGDVKMEMAGDINRPYLSLSSSPYDSLGSFLIERKANITNHVVIGNEAGDADTIVTAITLAFIESMNGYGGDAVTPIVAISKDVFHKERPDVNLLFQLAGLQEFTKDLLFIEDLEDILEEDVKAGLPSRSITLVDHNNLNEPLVKYPNNLVVTEILDHHEDLHKYEESCSGKDRNIAFDNGHALVASATTLVAERLRARNYPHPYPATIGTLLLGVIIIDSINLDESLGKVTERDRDAVKDLLTNTDWSTRVHLPHIRLNANGDITVDTDKLFDELQVAKYDPLFWATFPVFRALASDFKQFGDGNESMFGIATVLMNGQEFMKKEEFASATLDFMHTSQISFLGIMFAFYDESRTLRRQLAFVTKGEKFTLEQIVESLLKSIEYKNADLQLEEVTIHKKLLIEEGGLLQIRLFDQTNPAPSRKQIGPMFEVYFNGLEL